MPNANLPAIEIFSSCAKARDQAAGEFGKAKEDVASSLPCDLDQYKELLSFDEELAAAEEEAEAEAKVRGMRNASACIPRAFHTRTNVHTNTHAPCARARVRVHVDTPQSTDSRQTKHT